jgi:replication factor A1
MAEKEDRIKILTERVLSRFEDYDINPKEVSKRLSLLINEFKVPEEEAVRTVTNYIIKELDISPSETFGESPIKSISELSRSGEWVTLKVKVFQLWDADSPNVSQVGLIGDPTGIIKFVTWAKSRKPEVEEGRSYIFRNVVTDSYGGRIQVNINRNSEIIEIDEDISLPPREIEVVGALVAIQQNSGFIQRCKTCNRVIKKGICAVHGKTESYDDLRIKGVLDDGMNFYEVILNEENLKSLTGIGVEEAREIVKESLDRESVLEELKKRLLGYYFRVRGSRGNRYFIVREIEAIDGKAVEFADSVLKEIESLKKEIGV